MRQHVVYCGVLGVLFAVGVIPSAAVAQDSEQSAYDRAVQALMDGRNEEARDLFRASLTLRPRPSAAFNLATALRRTGEDVDALDVYDRLLSGEYGELDEERRGMVDQQRQELLNSIARVQLESHVSSDAVAQLGERPPQTLPAGATLELRAMPGEYELVIQAENYVPFRRTLTLAAGAVRPIDVALALMDDERAEPAPNRRPLRWILSIAAVLVAGAAVATIIAVVNSDREQTGQDGFFPPIDT